MPQPKPQKYSSLLIIGLVLGIFNFTFWVLAFFWFFYRIRTFVALFLQLSEPWDTMMEFIMFLILPLTVFALGYFSYDLIRRKGGPGLKISIGLMVLGLILVLLSLMGSLRFG